MHAIANRCYQNATANVFHRSAPGEDRMKNSIFRETVAVVAVFDLLTSLTGGLPAG